MARGAVPFAHSRRLVALLRPYGGGEGSAATIGVLLSFAAVGLQLLRPWPLKWVLDYLTGNPGGGDGPAAIVFAAWTPQEGMLLLGAAFIAIALAEGGVEYGRVLRIAGLGNRVVYRFRASLFAHLMAQPLAFHEQREVG